MVVEGDPRGGGRKTGTYCFEKLAWHREGERLVSLKEDYNSEKMMEREAE